MHLSSSTGAIILAAGSSSRMGAERHKLLLPLAGRPVLEHVIEATLASQARPIIIVLGHQADQVRSHIHAYAGHPYVTIVENADYLQGMSTSLHAGVRALMTMDNAQMPRALEVGSVLVVLGDQPLMTTTIIDTLIATWRATGKRIVAPLYNGKRGNPVLFDADLFAELLQTTGDEGGRSIIECHRQDMATVEIGNTMVSYDIDTWEAYQQVLQLWENES
jgi:molybdenum cofactor cytidylyltransferase